MALQLGAAAFAAALVLTAVACIRQRRTAARAAWLFAARFFGLWYAALAVAVLFKLAAISGMAGARVNGAELWRANLIPFATIAQYARERNFVQLIGNVAALCPLPILLRLNCPRIRFRRLAAIAAAVTCLIEPLQLLVNIFLRCPYNVIDIDDLILNALGTALGLCAVRFWPKRKGARR